LRDIISEQARINDNIAKRLTCNDKILESISAKMNSFSFVIKEQMIFNKNVEFKSAQLAFTLPVATNLEVKAITTRGGKSTRDPPYPKGAGKTPVVVQAETEKKIMNFYHKNMNYSKIFVTPLSYCFCVEIESLK
jgi:hypothetical protein